MFEFKGKKMGKNNTNLFLGNDNMTVLEGMRCIDANTYGILFVTNDERKLRGCITDGDVRRYLISGGKTDDNIMKAANCYPKVAYSIEEALHLYHKKNYVAIPIIDKEKCVRDVFLGESKRRVYRPINVPVVINAGGKGSRLDPYTRILPKPLIPVGDVPILEQIMREYQLYDCKQFHIIINYKKELIKAYFADNNLYNITWYDENEPLGTGGGLSLLRGKMKETFFFANCDVLLTSDYNDAIRFHKENQNVITMICAYKHLKIPYGIVEAGVEGIISKISEKPSMSFLTNTGVYIVEPQVIEDLKDKEAIGFPEIIEMERIKGNRVAVFPISENDWMDMGQLPELERMRKKLLGKSAEDTNE